MHAFLRRLYSSLLVNVPEERLRSMLTRGESGGADSAMLLRTTSVTPSESDQDDPPDVASYVVLERLFDPLVSSLQHEIVSRKKRDACGSSFRLSTWELERYGQQSSSQM